MTLENNNNTVIHGDAYRVIRELPDQCVDLIFTSPSPQQDVFGLVEFFSLCKRVLKNTGSLWVQMGDYHDDRNGDLWGRPTYFELNMTSHEDALWHLKNRIAWVRSERQEVQDDYRRFCRDWEYLFWFTKDAKNYYFNNPHNTVLSSVWRAPHSLPKDNSFESGFPQRLILDAMFRTCPPKGVVMDPFAGTGTTAVCAKMMGRPFIMVDIDEQTCMAMKGRLGIKY